MDTSHDRLSFSTSLEQAAPFTMDVSHHYSKCETTSQPPSSEFLMNDIRMWLTQWIGALVPVNTSTWWYTLQLG